MTRAYATARALRQDRRGPVPAGKPLKPAGPGAEGDRMLISRHPSRRAPHEARPRNASTRGRLLLAGAVTATLLAVNPVAAALRTEHTLSLKLSAKTAKKSTGATITTSRTITPPALRVTRIVFALPAGTKLDTAAATRCSVAVLQAQGAAGCKAGSAIGDGTAAAITGTPPDPIRQQVAVYVTTKGLAAILTPRTAAAADA